MARVIYKFRNRLTVNASDGIYDAEFCEILHQYKAWEIDRNNDTSMSVTEKTGDYRVRFFPVESSMKFPEDLKRNRVYEMTGENMVKLYLRIEEGAQYWFALDTASMCSK